MVLNLLHVGQSRFKDKVSQAKIAAGILDRKYIMDHGKFKLI